MDKRSALNMRFAVRIKKLMRQRNVSVEKAAAAFGVQPRTFEKWLTDGKRWMSTDIEIAVELLRTTYGYLFGETDDPDPTTPDDPHSGAGALRA